MTIHNALLGVSRNRLPVMCRTYILNPVRCLLLLQIQLIRSCFFGAWQIVSCLAGGRNKMAADKAYEFLNKECAASGRSVCCCVLLLRIQLQLAFGGSQRTEDSRAGNHPRCQARRNSAVNALALVILLLCS